MYKGNTNLAEGHHTKVNQCMAKYSVWAIVYCIAFHGTVHHLLGFIIDNSGAAVAHLTVGQQVKQFDHAPGAWFIPKIYLISPCCPRPSRALQYRIGLKHHSFIKRQQFSFLQINMWTVCHVLMCNMS